MKQHYDVRWQRGADTNWILLDGHGNIAASTMEILRTKQHLAYWVCIVGNSVDKRKFKNLKVAKRAAITRLMASTEGL